MPWIQPVTDEEWPDALAALAEAQRKHLGTVLNSARLSAYVPPIALGSAEMGRGLSRSHRTDKRLDHLLNLRVAAIVGCPL